MRTLALLVLLFGCDPTEERPPLQPTLDRVLEAYEQSSNRAAPQPMDTDGPCAMLCPQLEALVNRVCTTEISGSCDEVCAVRATINLPAEPGFRATALADPTICAAAGGEAPVPDGAPRPDGSDAATPPRDAGTADMAASTPCVTLRVCACEQIILEDLEDDPICREQCRMRFAATPEACDLEACTLDEEVCRPYVPEPP